MDHSPPGSSVHKILQARILELIAMPSSRLSSRPRDRTRLSHVSCIRRRILHHLRHLGRVRFNNDEKSLALPPAGQSHWAMSNFPGVAFVSKLVSVSVLPPSSRLWGPSLVAQRLKRLPVSDCSAGDLGSIPESGRSPGKGNPLQCSCLGNPMDGGAMGSQRVRFNWATSLSLTSHLCKISLSTVQGGVGSRKRASLGESPLEIFPVKTDPWRPHAWSLESGPWCQPALVPLLCPHLSG